VAPRHRGDGDGQVEAGQLHARMGIGFLSANFTEKLGLNNLQLFCYSDILLKL
jgi:hypothetical protein